MRRDRASAAVSLLQIGLPTLEGERERRWTEEPVSELRASPQEWPLGALVDDRYRLERRLGRGGMGVVFRAHDVTLDRAVAIKALDVDRCGEDELLRFRKEARALAMVRHDNVCQIYAFGSHGGTSYFAMELVVGRDLDSLVQEHVAFDELMPLDAALAVVRGMGRGLSAVHASGVVHRDVKPSNVIVEQGTLRPVLIDFGLAQRPSASSPRISLVGGTPSYMAPEQATDAKGNGAGPRADIYAFACSVFEILTGRPPFEGTTTYEILVKHLKEPPPAISSRRPELARLDDVLLRAMAKKPDERQATCDAFVAEIEAALA